MIARIKTKIRRNFFFKSFTNFTIGVLGFSGTGYFYTKWSHDKLFQHPLVNESIRLMGHNPQLVELAGYPITISSSLSSQAKVDDKFCRFQFLVSGPKGQATVELVGSSKEHGVINKDSYSQYYIPNEELSYEIFSNRLDEDKLKTTLIPKDQSFWKFDQLFIDVGSQGDYRVVLADTNESLPIQQKEIKFSQTGERQNLKDLKEEIYIRKQFQPQSDQDIEEIRKHRQQEMYRKVGSVRLVLIGIALISGMALYTYITKNKRLNIKRSQLHLQSLELIKRNPFVRENFGISPRFNDQLRGSQVGNDAEFETDIMGNKKTGIAHIKGVKSLTGNDWSISSIVVEIKNNDGKVYEKKKIV